MASASPWRYLVMTAEPGVDWMTATTGMTSDALRAAYRQLGEAVASIHSLTFPSFGELGPDAAVADDGPYPEALAARAERHLTNAEPRHTFLDVLSVDADCLREAQSPVLAHEDLNPGNILFERRADGWVLSAILDFDSAWAGSAESDLARLEPWRGMTRPAFWAGYQKRASLPDRDPIRTALLQLL